MKELKLLLKAFLCTGILVCAVGCTEANNYESKPSYDSGAVADDESITETTLQTTSAPEINTEVSVLATNEVATVYVPELKVPAVSLQNIPDFNGNPYVAVNDNQPYFSDSDYTTKSFELYSSLDSLGRCSAAYACIGQDIMPVEERGSIGQVKPSGWQTVKYDNVDGKYLYNRCHLIGYQLTGENANEKNLITGTRYMNVQGMLPFENMVADYVKETNNHVLYRATPVFEGDNLLADGVLMEGYSVEDKGSGICFNVFAYNVQPGINIDYGTGNSSVAAQQQNAASQQQPVASLPDTQKAATTEIPSANSYILNTNTKKFHYPSCSSAAKMSAKNKMEFNGTRDEVIAQGYEACKKCCP